MKNRMLLGDILNRLYDEMNSEEKVYPDPLIFVRQFRSEADIEAGGLIAACFAFGKVAKIMENLEEIFEIMGGEPARYLKESSEEDLSRDFSEFSYRFVNSEGMVVFLASLSCLLKKEGLLGRLVTNESVIETAAAIFDRLHKFSKSPSVLKKTQLLSDVRRGSAGKRWMLFFRWMVRKDNVDLGLWSSKISPESLIIPLDTHILRISRYLGFTESKTSSMKTAKEITEALRRFDPFDPVKYDFSLCHLGIREQCARVKEKRDCSNCSVSLFCNERNL